MVFSSLIFLFAFLPLTFIVYYAFPNRKYRNIVLLILSLVFYGWGEPRYVFIMICSIIIDYTCGYFVAKYRDVSKKKARIFVVISVVLNLGILCFFKYYTFFVKNLQLLPIDFLQRIPLFDDISLPIGISFYTFQTMSYTIDIYRGDAEVQKNITAFGAYVTMFPQLIAGPIVRYKDVDRQLCGRNENVDMFADGIRRFVVGLGKKILIGDACAAVYEYAKNAAEFQNTVVGGWLVVIFYSLHIYYDFSGYSDMAIGLGKMFGFDFIENFDYPYISQSITEFWRRWHISMGTWFREYLYIPLGGSRRGLPRQIVNLAIVWLVTGLWHGADWNFVLWGAYFGVILILEKAFLLKVLQKCPGFVRHIYSLLLVGIGWIIFSYNDIPQGFSCFKSLFGVGVDSFCTPTVGYTFLRSLPLLVFAAVGSTPYPKKILKHLCGSESSTDSFSGTQIFFRWVTAFGAIAVMILCTAYLVDSTFSPFLYFNF